MEVQSPFTLGNNILQGRADVSVRTALHNSMGRLHPGCLAPVEFPDEFRFVFRIVLELLAESGVIE